MNSDTKALLRHTILEAINSEQDAAAMELLALLTGSTPATQPAPAALPAALPAARNVIEGPARSYHYWAGFIRDNFFSHITSNGRHGFTSNEMFSWLENNDDLQWTAGDIQPRTDGTEIWRGTVSNARLNECDACGSGEVGNNRLARCATSTRRSGDTRQLIATARHKDKVPTAFSELKRNALANTRGGSRNECGSTTHARRMPREDRTCTFGDQEQHQRDQIVAIRSQRGW